MASNDTTTERGRRTRHRILTAATDLFHRQGVNATTVGDVLRESGTGKGQFCQHFAGRDELVVQVLPGHRDYLAQAPPITSWEDLERWLRRYLDAQRSYDFERGCPLGTAAYGLQARQAAARSILKEIFDRMRADIAAFLRAEQAAGRLEASRDTAALAELAVAGIQGASLLGLLDRDGRAAKSVIAEILTHLRSGTSGNDHGRPTQR